MIRAIFGLAIILGLTACLDESCDTPTSVDVPSPVEPPPEPKPEPEPFNPGPPIDLRNDDGFSAFAICMRDEQTQRAIWKSARNHGYRWGRVLSESFGWRDNKAFNSAAGRRIHFARNKNGRLIVEEKGALEDFRKCLKIAAEENMGMLVMGLVTSLRDNSHGGTDEKREAWVRAIGEAAADYDNVAWEIANEYWHPKSKVNRPDFLNRMMRLLRNVTGGQLVGADQNLGAKFSNTARYRYDYRIKSDFPSFHPWRNEDPDAGDIRDIVRENGGWVLLSETTSYGSEADKILFGWLVTTSREQIRLYMERCNPRNGCTFTYHSVEGLMCESAFSWMPRRRP
jgi:hypothetical protein